MTDYISREAGTKVLCDACGNAACPKGKIPRCSYYERMQAVPPADVVPVVRCRDCKWGKKTSKEGIFYHCGYPYEQTGKIHLPDWYCPGGARKEDAK